jgi:Flp pilus assembly protein TadD
MQRFALFCLFVFMLVTRSNAQGGLGQADWDRAVMLDCAGKHSQAAKLLTQLTEAPAFAYEAHMMLARIFFYRDQDPKAAFGEIAEAMRLEPDSARPLINRSSMYMDAGMADRAIGDLEHGIKLCRNKSDSTSLLLNRGSAYTMVRRFNDALRDYDMALAIDSTSWEVLSNKAAILDEIGRPAESRAIYLKLHEQKPEEIVILNNLGFQASAAEDDEEALLWFDKAREIAPDDPYVLNNLGYAQLRMGDVKEALRNVERSIKLNPGNSYAYRNLGLIWKEKGEKEKACTAYERALQLGFTEQYGPEVEQWRKDYCR